MGLQEYQRKRDFRRTPEPQGGRASGTALMFVVQKHAATRLHYDFRLELDGVLKSWAVTKGPSLDPADRRLAVETEDHPIDYGSFEGIIPKGQYGGGTVMLWDRGTWEPVGDPREGLTKGALKFRLNGEKMHGLWALIRMNEERGRRNWLLIRDKDDEARRDYDLLAEQDGSVSSGRDLDGIRDRPERVWSARREALQAVPGARATEFTHLFLRSSCGSDSLVVSHCFEEDVMEDFSLGRFGDRRLEKGGSFCTSGWLRWAAAASACAGLAAAGLGRSG